MGWFSKKKSCVGLDIGSSSIKLVELAEAKGRYSLVNLGAEQLTPEAIVDGAIMDAQTVSETIRKLFEENRVKTDNVAIGLSGHSVIIRRVSLPAMSPEELSESIHWEAEQYIPFDIEEVNLDYHLLDSQPNEEGNMDVLLVAVKKDKIHDYTNVISAAGKTPVVVDIDAFALQNAYEVSHGVSGSEVVALINVGASVTNVAVMQGAIPNFWRDIGVGGDQYTDAIQKELSLSYEQAERLKKGEEVEDIPAANVTPIIQSVSEELGNEIKKTLDFFKATASAEQIDRIALAGGSARIEGLLPLLGEKFGCATELMDPLRNVTVNPKHFDPAVLQSLSCSMAVAVGLALRRPGDKV